MNKTTIELARLKHIRGYGYVFGAPHGENKTATLDKLCEWSSLPENVNKKIVKHVVSCHEEPLTPIEYHYAPENSALTREDCARIFAERLAHPERFGHRYEGPDSIVYGGGMVNRVPYVDEIYTADIYWEQA